MTVVVTVALPQFRYTLSICTPKLSLGVAFSLMTNTLIFIAAIGTVVVRITDP